MNRIPPRWLAVFTCVAVLTGGVQAFAEEDLSVSADAASVTIKVGTQPLLVYRYVENPAKPYLAQLFTPAGVNVLRDSPADHKHHHGVMFAVAVDGVDFWSENPNCGHQRHQVGQEPGTFVQDGQTWAGGVQEIEWVAPDGKLLLNERRSMAARRVAEGPATVVLWKTELSAPAGRGPAKLTGAAYFGLGMRFVQSMDKGGEHFNSDGKTGVAGTNNVRAAWSAYTAAADGKPVTVAMFDSPNNPRHPATWFTMDQGFAYVAATLDLSKEPLVIEAGKPLVLRYGVAAWDGKADAAAVADLYKRLSAWKDR
jgi:hypothetical protein